MTFISALGDDDSLVRLAASKARGKIGDVRSVEPLTASLEDKEEYVCRSAAESLYKIGLSAGKDKLAPAVEVLIAALKDPNKITMLRDSPLLGDSGNCRKARAGISGHIFVLFC